MAGGTPHKVDELGVKLGIAAERGIEGITLLGGEPFAQAAAAAQLAEHAQQRGFSVMAFSGFTLAELHNRRDPNVKRLLEQTDLLVDGPFLNQHPDRKRRWIGSTNQQIHFLTNRYKAEDPCWKEPNTVELRWIDGELQVNGFPMG